jgi:hypothetical protein
MPFLNRSDLITGIIHHKSKTPEMCKVLAKASCEREAVNAYHRLKQQGSGREVGTRDVSFSLLIILMDNKVGNSIDEPGM